MDLTKSPEDFGFTPPWADWDFNEWETCTDNHLVCIEHFYIVGYVLCQKKFWKIG